MNFWTQKSVEFAQQHDYLDQLYRIYPLSPNARRVISKGQINSLQDAFLLQDNKKLIKELLNLELFPLKDSYVAFLRHDKSAIERNPKTINRLAGNLYDLGFDKILERCTEPKETNRQMGPMFKMWLDKNPLGVPIFKNESDFLRYEGDCIFNASDEAMKLFANQYLGFNRDKGLDFIGKFNGKYVIAEAKFLTDFGGHQNAQFADAISTMNSAQGSKRVKNEVIRIAICDGVIYIKNRQKFYKHLENHPQDCIISALLLREFLYSL